MTSHLAQQQAVRDVLCQQEGHEQMVHAARLPRVGAQGEGGEPTLPGAQTGSDITVTNKRENDNTGARESDKNLI